MADQDWREHQGPCRSIYDATEKHAMYAAKVSSALRSATALHIDNKCLATVFFKKNSKTRRTNKKGL